MLSDEYEKMMLIYLSSLVEGQGFRTVEDLHRLSSFELLKLGEKVDDPALGLFVQLLKRSQSGLSLFEKLMGDHEEENRVLVDAFFSRYMNVVLSNENEKEHYNPLEVYLPRHTLSDLAYVQSRQPFFLRQSIETINEYLEEVLDCNTEFQAGEQETAWHFFWEKVMEK